MKKFEIPEAEIVIIQVSDVITASGDMNLPEVDFGNLGNIG